MADGASRIIRLTLAEALAQRRIPEVEQERSAAIFDLLERNHFRLLQGPDGPYAVELGIDGSRLVLAVRDADDQHLTAFGLALGPFRRVVKDYFAICESYYDAIRHLAPSQIEAIDMGRRAVHNEGSELLRARLDGKVELDFDTARRLFTLLCVLHFRG